MMSSPEHNNTTEGDEFNIEVPAPYVDNGTAPVDPERYYTREFMEKEWDRVWTRIWNVAGRAPDMPEVGDYVTFNLLHESFILVRTGEGENDIRAFYNVCIHRGNRLVEAHMGHVSEGFACAYHGWVFDIDGSLKEITMREQFRDEVVAHLKGLKEVRCDLWAGFVFINMDDDAPPLLDYLGDLPRQLDGYHMERMVVVNDLVADWPSNWKTAMDNFNESYHVHWVHWQLHSSFDEAHQFDLYENGHCRTITKHQSLDAVDENAEVPDAMWHTLSYGGLTPENFQGTAGEAQKKLNEFREERAQLLGLKRSNIADGQLYYLLWPNMIISLHPEAAILLQTLPHETDPDKFTFMLSTIAHPIQNSEYDLHDIMITPKGTDLSGMTRPQREVIDFVDERLGAVLIQDTAIVPRVQRGMKSRGITGLIYGEREQRIRHLHKELDRYINGEK